jgi:hypothetical protein
MDACTGTGAEVAGTGAVVAGIGANVGAEVASGTGDAVAGTGAEVAATGDEVAATGEKVVLTGDEVVEATGDEVTAATGAWVVEGTGAKVGVVCGTTHCPQDPDCDSHAKPLQHPSAPMVHTSHRAVQVLGCANVAQKNSDPNPSALSHSIFVVPNHGTHSSNL